MGRPRARGAGPYLDSSFGLNHLAVVCALPRLKTIEDYRGLLRHKP